MMRYVAIACALVVATPAYSAGQWLNEDAYSGLYETGAVWEPIQDDPERLCALQGTLSAEFIIERFRHGAAEMEFDIRDKAQLRSWCEGAIILPIVFEVSSRRLTETTAISLCYGFDGYMPKRR